MQSKGSCMVVSLKVAISNGINVSRGQESGLCSFVQNTDKKSNETTPHENHLHIVNNSLYVQEPGKKTW